LIVQKTCVVKLAIMPLVGLIMTGILPSREIP